MGSRNKAGDKLLEWSKNPKGDRKYTVDLVLAGMADGDRKAILDILEGMVTGKIHTTPYSLYRKIVNVYWGGVPQFSPASWERWLQRTGWQKRWEKYKETGR